jgi:hypothetical protein
MSPANTAPRLPQTRPHSRNLARRKAALGRLARPRLESLEDRTLLDAGSLLQTLHDSATTATNLGSNLAAGVLARDLPILSGGTGALNSILGVTNTFAGIGSTLGGLSPTDIVNAGSKETDHSKALEDEQNALQAALGSGYTVNNFDDSSIQITFNQSVGGTVSNLSTTTNLTDFFGGSFSNAYLTNLSGLAGTANGTLGAGSFNVVFGVDGTGFFVRGGSSLLTSPDFSVTIPLTADHLRISNDVFDVGLTNGSATLDLKNLNLSLSQDVRSANPGSAASFSVDGGSSATFSGDFSLKVLNQNLLTWTPTLTWSFNTSTGAVAGAPQLDPGTPSIVDGAESAIQDALAGSLGGALGLDKLGVVLGPLADGLGSMQDFINVIGSALGDGINNGGINPQALLDSVKSLGNFSFFPGNDLQDVVMGKAGATIVSLQTGMQTLASTPSFNPHFPVGVISILGIINLIPELGLSFSADTSGELGFGVDTSGGVFIDTKNTDIDFTTKFGADFRMDVNVLGAFDNAAYFQVGPNVSAIAKLSLNPNGGTTDKMYLSQVDIGKNLNQSGALPALGSWLADQLHLSMDFKGDIGLTVGANIGPAAIVNQLPDAAATFIKGVEGVAQYVFDFINKVADTICNVIDVVPIIGPAFESLVDCHSVAKYTSVLFGDLQPAFQAMASAVGATYSEPNGLGSFQLAWDFPIVDVPIDLTGASNIDPTPPVPPVQSAPTDYINYVVNNGNLTIQPNSGDDTIQIHDAGNGQIRLTRFGQEPNGGPTHTDPDVVL